MSKKDLIIGKLKQVVDYGRKIQNKEFLINENSESETRTSKNEMAKAIVFQREWFGFMSFTKNCHETWTTEEEEQGIQLLDSMIDIYESEPETWDLFWEGKHRYNVQKMPFVVGGDTTTWVDLNELRGVKIMDFGIR